MTLSRVECRETSERRVKVQDVDIHRRRRSRRIVDRDASPLAGPLGHLPRPGPIDEDAPHDLRRHAKELAAVLPHDTTLIDQPQVRLVHERRRLQGIAGGAPAEGRRPPAGEGRDTRPTSGGPAPLDHRQSTPAIAP